MDHNQIFAQTMEDRYRNFLGRMMPSRKPQGDRPAPTSPPQRPAGPPPTPINRDVVPESGGEGFQDRASGRTVQVREPREMEDLLRSFVVRPEHGGALRQRCAIVYQRADGSYKLMQIQLGVKHPYTSVNITPETRSTINQLLKQPPEQAAESINRVLNSAQTPTVQDREVIPPPDGLIGVYESAAAKRISQEIRPLLEKINPEFQTLVRAVALAGAYRRIYPEHIQAIYAPGNMLYLSSEASEPTFQAAVQRIQGNAPPPQNTEGDGSDNDVLASALDERMKPATSVQLTDFELVLAQNLDQAITARQPVLEQEQEGPSPEPKAKTPPAEKPAEKPIEQPGEKLQNLRSLDLPSASQAINSDLTALGSLLGTLQARVQGAGAKALTIQSMNPLTVSIMKAFENVKSRLSETGVLG